MGCSTRNSSHERGGITPQPRHYLGSWSGSWPRSSRRAGSGPVPSRSVNRPRNEASILLCEGSVCAPWHKARQSTKEAPNFRELRYGEVRRIPIPRTSVNKGKMKEGRDLKDSTLPLLSPASAAGLISILRMEMEADLPKSSAGCPVAVAHARRQCRPRSHNRLQPHLSCPQTPSLCHRRKRLGPWLQDRCRRRLRRCRLQQKTCLSSETAQQG